MPILALLLLAASPAPPKPASLPVSGDEICALIAAAAPQLGRSGDKPRTRGGGWIAVEFEQSDAGVSGAWGSCPAPVVGLPPIEEILVSADGRAGIVTATSVTSAECQFTRTGRDWRKLACFLTFED